MATKDSTGIVNSPTDAEKNEQTFGKRNIGRTTDLLGFNAVSDYEKELIKEGEE